MASITVTSKPNSEPQQQLDDDEATLIDDPEEWFLETIVHDAAVCSRCFAEVQVVDPITDESIPLDEHRDRTPTATLDQDLVDAPAAVPSCYPLAHPRTTCLECGSIGCRTDRTLSRREALECVPALAARLQERDVDVDERVLREAVRCSHQREILVGDTARLFGVASKVAIEHS